MHRYLKTIPTVIGACALLFVLCLSAYREGLFFDADLYPLEIALIGCAGAAGLLGCLRPGTVRVRLWSYAPFAIAAVYGLLLALHPASVKGTTDAFLRWTAYGSWAVLLGVFFSEPRRREAGWVVLQLAGAFLVCGGLAGWFGWIGFPGIVFRSDQAELAATGARLAGFLQYPNAYGAVVACFALLQWQLLISRKRGLSLAAALLLVPALASLLLTESRGSILALAFGFVLSLALRDGRHRGYGLAAAGLSVGLSAAAAHSAFAAMKHGSPGQSVWTLLGAAAVSAFILYRLRPAEAGSRRREGDGRAILARAASAVTSVPGGLLVLLLGLAAAYALLAGGDTGGTRVSGNFETAAARQLYYADALRMFRDHPWLGMGGESWRMQVGLYQSRPYIGNEVHSGYLEILIDTGLLGFLLLAGMLILYAWMLRKRTKAAAAWGPAAVLLAHSAIDFDWSYGFVWLLLLYWLELHLADRDGAGEGAPKPSQVAPSWQEAPPAQSAQAALPAQAGSPAPPPRPPAARPRLRPAAPLCAALLLGFAAAALPAAWRSAAAAREHDASLAAAANPAAQAAHLRAALSANPAWTRIRLELAPLLPKGERASLLAAGLRYEPQSAPLQYQLGMTYAELGDPAAARDRLREALRLGRFDREAQNAAIARMATLAESYASAGWPDKSRVAAEAAAEFYERYRELYRKTYEGRDNPWNDKERALFSGAKTNAASALLLLGRTEEAKEILREVAEENSPEWRERAKERLRQLEPGSD